MDHWWLRRRRPASSTPPFTTSASRSSTSPPASSGRFRRRSSHLRFRLVARRQDVCRYRRARAGRQQLVDRADLHDRHRKGNATSIYKPSLQVAMPRWSPDGKSIAFIEGIMSDEGFHGGDLFTSRLSGSRCAESHERPQDLSQFALLADAGSDSSHGICRGRRRDLRTDARRQFRAHNLERRGGFSRVWQFSGLCPFQRRQSRPPSCAARYETPPEVWAGPLGQWRQLTSNNSALLRRGAKRKASSGLTTDSTFRDGSFRPRKSSPAKNIRWSF